MIGMYYVKRVYFILPVNVSMCVYIFELCLFFCHIIFHLIIYGTFALLMFNNEYAMD